jgi:hypothetical protein
MRPPELGKAATRAQKTIATETRLLGCRRESIGFIVAI